MGASDGDGGGLEIGRCSGDGSVDLWGRVILALLAAAVVARVLYKSTVGRRKLPPGPQPWPILGNLTSLSGLPHRSLHQLSQKFGGLMYLRLGSVPCIVISSADMAKELFKNHDLAISYRPQTLFARTLSGNINISFSPYGAYWRHLRKICATEFFTQKRIAAYKDERFDEIRASVKEMLEKTKPGDAINLHTWLHNLVSNNMTRMVLNKRYFEKDEVGQQEAREFDLVTATLFKQGGAVVIGDYIPYLSFISKWQGHEKAFWETKEQVLDIVRKMSTLDSRRKLREEGQYSDNTPHDFVDVMLSMPSETGKGGLSDETILLVIMDLLVAGTETSASTIEWTITELVRNPDIMKRAQAELDSVVGSDQLVQESDLENLPYLQAILKESFRLHPATPLTLPRESIQPFTLAGYNLPAKTLLLINQWAIHRDPATYDRPEEFNPERFVKHPEISVMGAHYQLLPFGTGRRICPGLPLAMEVIAIVVAHLVHSFDWSLPHGEDPKDLDMAETFGVSASRKTPLMVIPKPRLSASLY